MASVERDDRGIWGKAAIAIPAVVAGGLLAGWLSNSGMENSWYADLARPGIQPPSWLFGPIWATLSALPSTAVTCAA